MLRLKTYLRGFPFLLFAGLVISCNFNNTSPGTNDFLLKVDSISLPDTIRAGKSFEITFYGIVGFTTCDSFKTFNIATVGNEIDIQAWGTFDTHSTFCPDAMVTLDGTKLAITLPTPGMYRIVIVEPNNFRLQRSIVIMPTH